MSMPEETHYEGDAADVETARRALDQATAQLDAVAARLEELDAAAASD